MLRRSLCLVKEFVQGAGHGLGVGDVSHLVAEVLGEGLEVHYLLLVRFSVDTVDHCLALGSYEFSHGTVGQQHKLLYEPVGFLGDLLVNTEWLSVGIHFHLHLRPFKTDGAKLEALLPEDLGNAP